MAFIGKIKVTENFKLGMVAATGGLFFLVINMILGFLAWALPAFTAMIGIGFSLIVVGIGFKLGLRF